MAITPVILCGGSGTRLWPLSRRDRPMQFVPDVLGGKSLLEQTLERTSHRIFAGKPPVLVGNRDHRELLLESLDGRECQIVLEPERRDTAAATALICLVMVAQGRGEEPIAMLPSDHILPDTESFAASVEAAVPLALEGALVALGVRPTHPETGYGYARVASLGEGAYRIEEFVEKPPEIKAQEFLMSGNYFWNTGIFVFQPAVMLKEFEKYAPEVVRACTAAIERVDPGQAVVQAAAEPYASIRPISVDYVVMEKTDVGALVELQGSWSDVGTWRSVRDALSDHGKDFSGDVLSVDCDDTYIRGGSRPVIAIGLSDTVIVDTDDVVLVCAADRSQEVKQLVGRLSKVRPSLLSSELVDEKPWGRTVEMSVSEGYLLKRLEVEAGQALSLQAHEHREEHWIVVQGQADVEIDGAVKTLATGDHVHVPQGAVHRIRNSSDERLVIVEVQTGEYLGEDDIIRHQDLYGRADKRRAD